MPKKENLYVKKWNLIDLRKKKDQIE